MNKVIMIGRLTKNPEARQLQSGIPCTTFSIAVPRRFRTANGERESDFFNVVAWRQAAEYAAKYLLKGQRVTVEGSIQTRSYTAQDGSTRRVTEIVADNVESLAERQQEAAQPRTAPVQIPHGFDEVSDPELPF